MGEVIHAQFGAEQLWQQAVGAEFVVGYAEQVLPKAICVAEMPEDAEITRLARKNLLSFRAAEIAVAETVEPSQRLIKDQHEAALLAREGNTEARAMVLANVSSHAMEVLFKAGNYTRVELDEDANGEISQNGQKMKDIHHNSYHLASDHPVIKERTIPEAKNGARIEHLNRQGLLKDYVFAVFSLCPEDLSDKELDKLYFFSQTKSLSIQITSKDEAGLYTETAFVAGADAGGERHDRLAVEQIAREFGEDYSGLSTAEIIDRPMLIHKSLVPDGVIDLTKMFDQINGTFFGLAEPVQDYDEFKEFCRRREANFASEVEAVASQLIAEAPIYSGPKMATQRQGKLLEERLVGRAVEDKSLEVWVFGAESARNIVYARKAMEDGRLDDAQTYQNKAVETARTGACTGGSCGLEQISIEDKSEVEELLDVKSGEHTVADKERGCKNCGKKSVVYAYTSAKVKKGCLSCKTTEGVVKQSYKKAA